MKNIIETLTALTIRFNEEYGEYEIVDSRNGNCSNSDRTFLSDSEAENYISEYQSAVKNILDHASSIRFLNDNRAYSLEEIKADFLSESWEISLGYGFASDYVDAIILKKDAYRAFCEMVDFINNWGWGDRLSGLISLSTEDEILDRYQADAVVLLWNEHKGEFLMVENQFIAEATAKASGI